MLADQREEAAKAQERVQAHLNAMAMRLGELQAQMLRWRTWASASRSIAGPEAAGAAHIEPGKAPGRGGAESSLPARNLSADEFAQPARHAAAADGRRAPTSCRCSRRCLVHDSANRKFLPTLCPIVDGWYSSNFG